jgi:hypothetical protein
MNRLTTASSPEHVNVPHPPAPGISSAGFCAIVRPDLPPQQLAAQQYLYQIAFAEAQAVARPSLPERDLPGVWN